MSVSIITDFTTATAKGAIIQGPLDEILRTKVQAGCRAYPSDVTGTYLEMGTDGKWDGASVGSFGSIDELNALPTAYLATGARASANGVQYTYSAGAGWVAASSGDALATTSVSRAANREIMQQAVAGSGCLDAYNNAAESSELWENTTAWTLGVHPLQVFGGRLYAGDAFGSGSWAYKALGTSKRVRTTIAIGDPYYSGYVFVGVGPATPNGLSGCTGVAINSNSMYKVVAGVITQISDILIAKNSTYDVDICINKDGYISCTIAKAGTVQGITIAAAIPTATGFVMFNSSAGATSGASIGPIDFKSSIAPMRSANASVGLTRFHSSSDASWGGAILHLPASFSALKAYRVVVMFHGNGTDEYSWSNYPVTDARYPAVLLDLLQNDYVCLCVSESLKTSWGRQQSVNAYKAALLWAMQYAKASRILVFGNSMGGIESLNAINQGAIPALAAYITSGTANLANCYENTLFTGAIAAAYTISGDYSEKTKDHDPMLFAQENLMRCAFSWATATDDAAVDPVQNSQLMHAKMLASSVQSEIELTTGGHSFSYSTPAWMAKVRAFYDRFSPTP